MGGKTKVIVDVANDFDDEEIDGFKVGDIGYIDGYVTEGTSHFAMVVFDNGKIEPVHYSRLKVIEEII